MSSKSALGHRWSRDIDELTASSRPALAACVTFESADDGGRRIVAVDGVPSSRVSPAIVDLLSSMDGASTIGELHDRFAASESVDAFLALVGRFQRNGLLVGSVRTPPGRLTYRPPLTLQIATLSAPRLFSVLERLVRPFVRLPSLVLIVGILAVGAVSIALQVPAIVELLVSPMPLSGLIALVAMLTLLTLLHESAHGLTLTRYGGNPRRAGFMLFYLTPAFFVDVTDGWRLSDRRKRVMIALAGPAVHAVVGAACAIAALLIQDHAVRQTLLVLTVACAAIVIVNLIPFVRFDGYIALMSALDEPNLRVRTIEDGADWLSHALYGGLRSGRRLDAWWSVPFGIASLLAPVVLVVLAVARIAGALAGGGPLLSLLVLALEAAVGLVAVVIVVRALRRVLRSGVKRWRFWLVNCSMLVLGTVAGAVITVPSSVTLGFVLDEGRIIAVHTSDRTDLVFDDGTPVTLLSNGIMASAVIGEGAMREAPAGDLDVPLRAFVPLDSSELSLPAAVVGWIEVAGPVNGLPVAGRARIDTGVTPIAQALWESAVMQPLAELLHKN